jgi:hypothetical protein
MAFQVDPYTASETAAIQAIETITSTFSIFGCGYALQTVLFPANNTPPTIFEKMIQVLLGFQLVLAVLHALGIAGATNSGLCAFQGFSIQWCTLGELFWMMLVSYQLYSWIFKKRNPDRFKKYFVHYIVACCAVATIGSLVLLFRNEYGPSTAWCWTQSKKEDVYFYLFFAISCTGWFLLFLVLLLTSQMFRTLVSSLLQNNNTDIRVSAFFNRGDSFIGLDRIDNQTQSKLRQYLSVFLFTWFFSLLSRLIVIDNGGELTFGSTFIVAMFVPFQGFLYAVCYTDWFGHSKELNQFFNRMIERILTRGSPRHMQSEMEFDSLYGIEDGVSNVNRIGGIRSSTMNTQKNQSIFRSTENPMQVRASVASSQKSNSSFIKRYVPFSSKVYNIFTTTFNAGEAPIEKFDQNVIRQWILTGYPIYVIAFQECICLEELRSLIHSHLGTTSYDIFNAEMGSANTNVGFHGFIALSVFVDSKEIRKGHITHLDEVNRTLATGKDLMIYTAENKGGVGLHFQIFDTDICFVGSHLTSDSKGASKLSKRNDNLNRILSDLVLGPADIPCLQIQHDHLIFMGDLNYRMNLKPLHHPNLPRPSSTEFSDESTNTITTSVSTNDGNSDSDDESRDVKAMSMTDLTQTLNAVAQAVKNEKNIALESITNESILSFLQTHTPKSNAWATIKYSLLRSASDPLYPGKDLINQINRIFNEVMPDWESVLAPDELRDLLKQGKIFHNFIEPLPMFPPSYKLRTGESGGCGDFSDYDEMVAGYLINTKDKDNHAEGDDHDTESVTRVASEESITPRHTISDSNKAGGSPGGSIKSSRSWGIPSSLSSQKSIRFHEDKEDETAKVADDVMPSYESTKNSEGNTDSTDRRSSRSRGWGILHTSILLTHKSKDSTKAEKGGKPAKAKAKNIRPPSYTDRILSHSLDEKRASLQCIGYNMCHQVLCSDHRPVSAVYSLEVNDNTKGALQSLSMNVELFEVLMQNFKIEYFHPVERSGKDKQSESSRSFSLDHEIKEIRIVLPLPTKDPLLQKKQDYGTHKIFGVRGAEDPIMTPLIECIHGVKGNIDHLFDLQVTIPWVPDTKCEAPSELKSVYAAGDIKRYGCISTILGAHVLMVIVNKKDEVIGNCSMCLNNMVESCTQTSPIHTASRSVEIIHGSAAVGRITSVVTVKYIINVTEILY